MTLQTLPIVIADGYAATSGEALRDLPFLGPANTELPVFRLEPTLDRVGYQLALAWMQLSQVWIARQLLTRDGQTVTLGIMLTSSGCDLFATYRAKTNTPAGQLWYAFDDGTTAPGRNDWRGTAHLYYRPAELASQLEGTDRALL